MRFALKVDSSKAKGVPRRRKRPMFRRPFTITAFCVFSELEKYSVKHLSSSKTPSSLNAYVSSNLHESGMRFIEAQLTLRWRPHKEICLWLPCEHSDWGNAQEREGEPHTQTALLFQATHSTHLKEVAWRHSSRAGREASTSSLSFRPPWRVSAE